MAALLNDDLLEQILIRSDVEDLIRYKSVCKPWYSLIKSSGFIRRHKDRCNNEHGDKRIILHYGGHITDGCSGLVGSSNGLVCASSLNGYEVFVGNPITREVRKVNKPPLMSLPFSWLPWGFGYDSSRDDYKVFFATGEGYYQVFSLKLNMWSEIGIVKYKFITTYGILCNGALHWVVYVRDDKNKRIIFIMSYDLSNDKFEEIHLPGDVRCESLLFYSYQLGNYKGCLCLFCIDLDSRRPYIWVMNKYGVKESWEELQQPRQHSTLMQYDIIFYRKRTPHENGRGIFQKDTMLIRGVEKSTSIISNYVRAPVYVQSLVSPHVNA